MISLAYSFREVERFYAIIGACFMPFLAAALLYLNGRPRWVGERYQNRVVSNLILLATLLFFLFVGYLKIRSKLG